MDEVDAVRRPRPKDSFQNELQAKMRQRKTLGLSAEITDSEEDIIAPPRYMDFMKSRPARPSSAKRRPDHSPNLGQGLGTTTMRARDLSSLLGRSDEYDEDEEIVQANLGKYGSGGRLPSPNIKTPSPKDSSYMRKTPTFGGSPKDQTGRLDSLYGMTTPTMAISPRSGSLSKEDIIFGRKTPTERRSPFDGSKTRLPGMESDRPWQPPNFRSASPGLSDHSRGSGGVTPVDAALGTISETPGEKYGAKTNLGQRKDASPRELSLGDRPKPQARSRVGDSRTPPLVDPGKKSPSSPSEGTLKRSTPTLDLFGGRSRGQAAQEVEGYIEKDKKPEPGRRLAERTPDGKISYGRDRTPEGQLRKGQTSPTGRFTRDGRKTPTNQASSLDRQRSVGRKTPTDPLRKSPLDKKVSPGELTEGQPKQPKTGSTLLDFLTEDVASEHPKRQERRRTQRQSGENKLALMDGDTERKTFLDGRKSPVAKERKMPTRPKSISSGVSFEDQKAPFVPQRPEDTSSLCEEIPPDPNHRVAREAEKMAKSGKQTTERAQADNVIDTIADAQGMHYIQPAKKIRPVTAEAKVQHRPKPRYGILPGQEKPLEERQFNSTSEIRDAIYWEWYKERQKSARKKKEEEEKKKKMKEEEEVKKKIEKKEEAEASYKAWIKLKKIEAEDKRKEEEEKKQKEETDEENNRKEPSTGSFDAWRKVKEEQIMKEKRERSEKEQAKKDWEEWQKKEKEKNRMLAHKAWEEKKRLTLDKQKSKHKEEKKQTEEQDSEKREQLRKKQKQALKRYNDWMEKKEEKKEEEKRRTKHRSLIEEENPKPAWYPSNNTIPFGR